MAPLKGEELDALFLKYMDKSETFRNTVSFISYLNIIFGWNLEEKDKDEELITKISQEKASKELKSETCDSTSHEVRKAKPQNVYY